MKTQWNLRAISKWLLEKLENMKDLLLITSSNHRLESAGLTALEELLFKMLGMGREDSDACLVCKGN